MIEVINRQRKYPVEVERWREFAEKALRAIDAEREANANVVFISDRLMRSLNRQFRGRSGTTDVLSFPSEQLAFEKELGGELGEVVISVERAAEQAGEHDLDFDTEIAQLILHGLLHLCGYDHETDDGEMNRFELKLRRRLKI